MACSSRKAEHRLLEGVELLRGIPSTFLRTSAQAASKDTAAASKPLFAA